MSPRAACRLESLGFTHVFDYVAGKADWFASGLPRAGREASRPRAGDIARRDVPTCSLADRIGDVQKRLQATGWTLCIVVNESGVVLGRLRQKTLAADPESFVETVMESGPSTIRPDVLLESITERMRERRVDSTVVTTSDGRLVGILYRGDAEQHLHNSHLRTEAQP